MTIKTWKEEFYPVDASEVSTKRGAILHSIRKWKGLLPENLERHGIRHGDIPYNIVDKFGETFDIDIESCALCTLYYDYDNCVRCPLAHTLGKRCDDGRTSPFNTWIRRGVPESMIMALEKTLLQAVRMEDK